jgi:plasmid maintenance system antidote protein VapI
MFDNFNKLDSYPSFVMTNGMILKEMMDQKKLGFNDLFSILGPKNVVIEVISGKRSLKQSQMKQLAELFGTNSDVFNLLENNEVQSNSNLGFEETDNAQNPFLSNEESNENNSENMFHQNEMNSESDSEQEGLTENNDFAMKPYWND